MAASVAAEPAGPKPALPQTPQPADPVDRFKTLVDAKNLGEFELSWREYIEGLYDREIRHRRPGGAVVPLAGGDDGEGWQVDRLVIADDPAPKVIEGMIRGEDSKVIDFFEIRRVPGTRLNMQRRPIQVADVLERDALTKEQRAKLAVLIKEYQHRKEIDTLNKKTLEFGERRDDFKRLLKTYKGNGFELESTADDDTIRETAVRIDQRLKAYRLLLPPRNQPMRPFRILVLGSELEYQKYLADVRLKVASPAFYSPETNQVVAYSERDRVMRDWNAALQQNKAVAEDAKNKRASLQAKLAADAKVFREMKFPTEAIREKNKLQLAAAAADISRLERKLDECERNNDRKREELIDDMYRVLYHELFHGYLESYVYNHQQHDVPRWLNEGLAQVVENGRLESGRLRIDAPDLKRLERLHADLGRADSLTLMGLLNARPESFLAIHGPQAEADRYYLYSWGLAYYLAFQKGALKTKALDAFVTPTAARAAR